MGAARHAAIGSRDLGDQKSKENRVGVKVAARIDSEPPQASLAHILSGSCAGNKEEARHFMRKLDKHTARATARVQREAPDSKDTATFLRRARAASLKAKGSRFGALAEEEYDKIAPVIACTLPALTDSIPERKRRELAGEVTSELQVVGKAASIAIQTWVRNNDKTKARAEEREKNIGWIKRLFAARRRAALRGLENTTPSPFSPSKLKVRTLRAGGRRRKTPRDPSKKATAPRGASIATLSQARGHSTG